MKTHSQGACEELGSNANPVGDNAGQRPPGHPAPSMGARRLDHAFPTKGEMVASRAADLARFRALMSDGREVAPVAASPRKGEPFRLFLRKGSPRYRVTFCISGVRYEGSTRCEEHDLAVMVARGLYMQIKEMAGRLAPDDPRRVDRSMRSIRGCWLTLRPKRMPLHA